MSARFLERKAARTPENRGVEEQGFSLVETLIACFILMFGLLGMASLLSYAVATNLENKSDAFATTLAVRKMEELKGQPSTALADGGCTLASSGDIDFSASGSGWILADGCRGGEPIVRPALERDHRQWIEKDRGGGPAQQRDQANAAECFEARQHP